MSVTHAKVSKFVRDALVRVNLDTRFRSVEDAIESAWTSVNAMRLNGDCGEDLAAAEHYLYCRYLVATHGIWILPILESMSTFYDLAKLLGLTYSEGSCPPSPPSIADSNWKARGARDGVEDYFGFTKLGSLTAPRTP